MTLEIDSAEITRIGENPSMYRGKIELRLNEELQGIDVAQVASIKVRFSHTATATLEELEAKALAEAVRLLSRVVLHAAKETDG